MAARDSLDHAPRILRRQAFAWGSPGAYAGASGREHAVEPADVVQKAIDAYHAHELDRCMSFY